MQQSQGEDMYHGKDIRIVASPLQIKGMKSENSLANLESPRAEERFAMPATSPDPPRFLVILLPQFCQQREFSLMLRE